MTHLDFVGAEEDIGFEVVQRLIDNVLLRVAGRRRATVLRPQRK